MRGTVTVLTVLVIARTRTRTAHTFAHTEHSDHRTPFHPSSAPGHHTSSDPLLSPFQENVPNGYGNYHATQGYGAPTAMVSTI